MSVPDPINLDLHVAARLYPESPSAIRHQFILVLRDAVLLAYQQEKIELVIAQELWRALPTIEART